MTGDLSAGGKPSPQTPLVRLRDGQRWLDAAPTWSTLSAVGWFGLAKAGYRFDRHFHDCAEYWAIAEGRARIAVGDEEFDVGPGDLVCTQAGVEHDILRAYTDDVMLLFIQEPVPQGGTAGHRHRDPDNAWHDVSRDRRLFRRFTKLVLG